MADVFSQVYIQLVFCPARRQALIRPEWEDRLYKYITGVIQNKGHKLLAINGMPDHIHILIGFKPAESISDLVKEIKNASNFFINSENLSKYEFKWQQGYGVFSYSRWNLDTVIRYILNQKQHHEKKKFKDEFLKLCIDFEIEMGRKTNFDFFEG